MARAEADLDDLSLEPLANPLPQRRDRLQPANAVDDPGKDVIAVETHLTRSLAYEADGRQAQESGARAKFTENARHQITTVE
jgi:hypothetical protein